MDVASRATLVMGYMQCENAGEGGDVDDMTLRWDFLFGLHRHRDQNEVVQCLSPFDSSECMYTLRSE